MRYGYIMHAARILAGCWAALALGPGLAGAQDPGDPPIDETLGTFVRGLPPRTLDDGRAARAGIRKYTARHLTLYTDLPANAEVDALPGIFDQAFPQWCDYFGLSAREHAAWRMTGFVMRDKTRFQQTGLLPGDLPPIRNGFCRNDEFWIFEQRSDYYRRHLVLHEGTHGFMLTLLGGCGPTWYMEGIAEMLATHRWRDGRLQLDYLPAAREEVPVWGRIELVQTAVAERRAKPLAEVLRYVPTLDRPAEAYAWCWAAAAFLERHPRYHARFRQLPQWVTQPDFNARFRQLYAADWPALCEEWEVAVVDLQYAHDLPRTAIDFLPGRPLPAAGTHVGVAVDRGWQSSQVRLEAGVKYRLRAAGRYQLDSRPQPWWSEPNGITLHYHQHRPLGLLLAAVRPDAPPPGGTSALLRPIEVGLGTTIAPAESGTLYLKINDSPAQLSDNAGKLTVDITRAE